MALDSVWVASAVNASRHSDRRKGVGEHAGQVDPTVRHQLEEVRHCMLADAVHLLDAEGVRPHPRDLLEVERR